MTIHKWVSAGRLFRPDALLLKSSTVGLVATAVDLSLLHLLIDIIGLTQDQANIPSLMAGSLVQFFGHRHAVFHAQSEPLWSQALSYSASEFISFTLNALGFSILCHVTNLHFDVVRLLTTFVVYFSFSFPVWKFIVFKRRLHRAL